MKKAFRRISSLLLAVVFLAALPLTALAATVDLAQGSVEITDTGYTQNSVTQSHEGSVTVTQSNAETPTGNTVTITTTSKDVDVTLSGVNIVNNTGTSAVTVNRAEGTTVTVELDGDNLLSSDDAAMKVTGQGELVIQDENSDGFLHADSTGNNGAGIGGGNGQDGSNITITGGFVDAFGGTAGAGIGGGGGGSGTNITITGTANVYAMGGAAGGAAIGSGKNGSQEDTVVAQNITISGDASVVALGGDAGGAGIGGGWNSNAKDISIEGGSVMTQGKGGGAGIGGGYAGGSDDIAISSGAVFSKGSSGAAGIGGGFGFGGGDITISGDTQLNAIAGGQSSLYPGYQMTSAAQDIGNGQDGSGANVDTSGLYTTGSINHKPGLVEPPVDVPSSDPSRTLYAKGRLVDENGACIRHLFDFGSDWTEEYEEGILTITAPEGAELVITADAMRAMMRVGIRTIAFGGTTLQLAELAAGKAAADTYSVSGGSLMLNGGKV